MTKYIISSGFSVVSEILETEQITTVQVTNEVDKAISFNSIGEAMFKTIKVNKILNLCCYRVISIEI